MGYQGKSPVNLPGIVYDNNRSVGAASSILTSTGSGVEWAPSIQGAQGTQGTDGAQGIQGIDGTQGTNGTQGTDGTQGIQGTEGNFGGATFDYTFTTSTSGDPGAGKLGFDNTTLSSATTLNIDDTDDNGTDIQTYLRTIDDSSSTIKGHFRVSNRLDASDFALFTISSLTEQSGYFQVTCSYVSGSASSFSDSEDLIITFARTGDKGDTGTQGTDGTQGIQGIEGSQGTDGAQGSTGADSTVAGPQGTDGAQGTDGTQGADGAQGIQGTDGAQGTDGTQGTDGAQGADGAQGSTGADSTVAGPQGTDGAQGADGAQGIQGTDGAQGTDGTQGTDGAQGIQGTEGNFGGASFEYNYSSSTSGGDPGSGNLTFTGSGVQFNQDSATGLQLDDEDINGTDIQAYLRTIDDSTSTIKGHVKISKKLDSGSFILFTIDSAVEENNGWFNISISSINSSAANPFGNGDDLIATFARTGDKGDTGTQGADGAQGTYGTQGIQGAQGFGLQGIQGSATLGIKTDGTTSTGVTSLHFSGPGVSTAYFGENAYSGIATVFFQGGGGGTALTVKEVASQGGATNVTVSNVSEIQFNNGSGFNVTDEGGGTAFVDLGSTFNPWYVNGEDTLSASGEEPIEIIAGAGIAITTKSVASAGIGTTFSKAITFAFDDTVKLAGTNIADTSCYIPFVRDITASSRQSLYGDSSLRYDATNNRLISSLSGSVTGSVYGSLYRYQGFDNSVNATQFEYFSVGAGQYDAADFFTSSWKGGVGVGSTGISLVGTSGTNPSTIEMIISIYPTNTSYGGRSDQQISKLLVASEGSNRISFIEYGTVYQGENLTSPIASFDLDSNGDSGSIRLLVNNTGVGNSDSYVVRVLGTYSYNS